MITISKTPRGMVIPRINARLGPLEGCTIEPPFTDNDELVIGIPPILFPDYSLSCRELYCVVAWFDSDVDVVVTLPLTITDP